MNYQAICSLLYVYITGNMKQFQSTRSCGKI